MLTGEEQQKQKQKQQQHHHHHQMNTKASQHKVHYIIRKKKGKDCFSVKDRESKRVFAKCSTKKNAEKQVKLLYGIHYSRLRSRRKDVRGV